MRMTWILLFSKFCGNGAANQQFWLNLDN
jgi:hypothetical protein